MKKHGILLGLIAAVVVTPVFGENCTVAEGKADGRSGAKAEVVRVILVRGRAANEGCLGHELIIGAFAIKVQLPGGRTITTSLNELVKKAELRFECGPVGITFLDLTHDGRRCFGLSEVSCGANAFYRFFAISPDGNVKLLRFAPPPDGCYILGNDTVPYHDSLRDSLRETPDGFEADTFNNADDKVHTSVFRWVPENDIFMQVAERVVNAWR